MTEREAVSFGRIPPSDPATVADEIRAIARIGLTYTVDEFDRARYRRLLDIAAGLSGAELGREPAELAVGWERESGYVTPKVGVAGVIFDAAGRVLLLQRPDSGKWALPGGWADVGESAAENAAREVLEETGLSVVPRRLLGLYDSRLAPGRRPHQYYLAVFECQIAGGEAHPTPEALAVDWFAAGELPNLATSHAKPIADSLAGWPCFGEPTRFEWHRVVASSEPIGGTNG